MFLDDIRERKEQVILTIDSFLMDVQDYDSFDDALANLPAEYIQFYLDNERIINKSLKKIYEGAEDSNYLGWAKPSDKVIKKIKYKGEILIIEYDNESKLWDAYVGYRSIVQALKQGKKEIDLLGK